MQLYRLSYVLLSLYETFNEQLSVRRYKKVLGMGFHSYLKKKRIFNLLALGLSKRIRFFIGFEFSLYEWF